MRRVSSANRPSALLLLTLVLSLGEFEGNKGHAIPSVMDADEQEQQGCRGEGEECRCRRTEEQKRGDEERNAMIVDLLKIVAALALMVAAGLGGGLNRLSATRAPLSKSYEPIFLIIAWAVSCCDFKMFDIVCMICCCC